MAARPSQIQRVVLSLTVLLAYLLLKENPPIRLPGKGKGAGKSGVCPLDGGEVVPARSGKYICQKCGKVYPQPPKPR